MGAIGKISGLTSMLGDVFANIQCAGCTLKPGSGELDRVMQAVWNSDQDPVVLEVVQGKSTTDTELSTWQEVLHDFEEEGLVDFTINGHECDKPPAAAGEDGPGLTSFAS